jgi:MoaE-MoaD fusion protein
MRLEVRLFGGLADRVGAAQVTVDLDEPATIADLRHAVAEQHPTLARLLARTSVAVDLEVADDEAPVTPASEVALLPPVAGGSDPGAGSGRSGLPHAVVREDGRRMLTELRTPPLPVDAAVAAISGPAVGGVVTFLGRVRDHAPDLEARVVRLDYEAYPAMAERVLAEIADEVLGARDEVLGVALLHAVGQLAVGEPTILVACAAAHRGPAFDACRDALEATKERVPVFKREVTAGGAHRWVGLGD